MADIIDHLKAHARILHRQIERKSPTASARIRRLSELKSVPESDISTSVRRRHCLTVVAMDVGFNSWPDAVHALNGENGANFGTLLHPPGVDGHWNIWCASHDEAKSIRQTHGGYLLTYKHQFLVVDSDYVDSMGLDRDDPDWTPIGRDWADPRDLLARKRLCEKMVRQRLAANNPGP